MGIYVIDGHDVCVIDTGWGDDTARELLLHIAARGWHLRSIINTHSHADHIGGNSLLQKETGCDIYCVGIENAIIRHPILDTSYLYGGCVSCEMEKKSLIAAPSIPQELTESTLPEGLTFVRLDGHSFQQIGIKTSDGVWFLGDAVIPEEMFDRYGMVYLQNVGSTLKSLDVVKSLTGTLFIASHAAPTVDIKQNAEMNHRRITAIAEMIIDICRNPRETDGVLSELYNRLGQHMTLRRYAMYGSTLRSYLAYLQDEGRITCEFKDGSLLWRSTCVQ